MKKPQIGSLILAFAILLSSLSPVESCVYYPDFTGTIWLYCSELMDRENATAYCESRGFHLASIQTAADYNLLRIVLGFFVLVANVK